MSNRRRIKKLEEAFQPKPGFKVVIYDPALPETKCLPHGMMEKPRDTVIYIAKNVAAVC